MAKAVALDRWNGSDVRLGAVVDTLAELRRSHSRTASRSWVMTLVAVASTDEEAYQATQVLRALGTNHPARLLVLRLDPAAGHDGIDAHVTVYGSEAGGRPVTFDEVGLTIRGAATEHLESILEPFTLSDLPVVVWYPATLPAVSDRLVAAASTVLVDTRDARDVVPLIALSERRAVVDLSWLRLRPWREMVAALFEPRELRGFARSITAVEISGKGGPRRLLAGWLASRLALPKDRIGVHDARHARVVLHAGSAARFEVAREAGERVVQATVDLRDGPSHHRFLTLPDDSLMWSLSKALTQLGRDRVWQEALAAGVVADGWG